MKIRITESQYRILVNKPRDIVFGNINEGGGGSLPKETPEEIDARIEEILNHVRNGGEFIRNAQKDDNFKWLKGRLRNLNSEKFKKAFDQIEEIQEELENKKIEEILNHVRNGGGLTLVNYEWLKGKIKYDKSEEKKFKKAFDQIKKIREELKNKEIDAKIKEILNHVRNGDGLSIVNYGWLTQKIETDTSEEKKFKKVFDQIKKIQEELENKKIDEKIEEILNHVRNGGSFIRDTTRDDYYKWLYNKSLSDKTEEKKFQNALDQIYEIQVKLGIKREYWGEKTIKQVLEQMGFEGIPQLGEYKIDDCKNSITCNQYKFDVYLPYNENNYMVGKDKDFYIPETGIIFEYDGIQHFEPIEYFKGEEGFRQRIHSDKEKNSYCQNNNIKLVRISYTTKTYHEINHEVFYGLKSKNTNGNIITTGNYPQLGWNQK